MMHIGTNLVYLGSYLIMAYLLWIRKPHLALALFAVALVLQLIVDGYHWQFIPLYALLALPLALLLWRSAPQWVVGGMLVVACFGFVLSGVLRYALPDVAIPKPTGQYAVGITEYTWPTGARAKIWYPATTTPDDQAYGYLATFDQPILGLPPLVYSHLRGKDTFSYQDAQPAADVFPVVIYDHGGGGHAEDNTFLLTDLASHGFVVISVIHTHAIADYDLDLAELSATPEQFFAAMTERVMPDRVADLALVVNGLADLNQRDKLLAGRLDLSQFNLIGYSLGGGVVTDYCAMHSVCRAVVNLDGNPFIAAHQTGINAPYLHVSQHTLLTTAEGNDPTSAATQMGNRYKRDVRQVVINTSNNGHAATWLLLNNSGHGSFTDMAYWIAVRWGMLQSFLGTVEPESAHAALRELTRAFLQDPTRIEAAKSRHQGLLSDFPG